VSVVDPYTDTILYEFDSIAGTSFGLEPIQNAGKTVYLVTPAKNTYSGIFTYSRYHTGNIDGVAVTNILPLEEYVEGVLPWEIGSGWPQESLRTFAVAIRSYALSSRKHETFDVCNDTCCQVYKGRNRVNDAVTEAVSQTAGIVLSYNNNIVCTYYSSSTGGTTVSASDAWGYTEKYPYLQAVVTPWEQYESYPNASWTIEYTPTQLLAKLNAAGYTSLSGSIKSVQILNFAENSSYVKSLMITDIKGNSITINRSDAIRTSLGLNSANFVVAKASENVTITDYSLEGEGIAALLGLQQSGKTVEVSGANNGIYVLTGDKAPATLIPAGSTIALTSEIGMDMNIPLTGLSVISENGIEALEITAADGKLPDLTSANVIKTNHIITTAGSAGNFVFIGRGWGHGVGLSQYGAKSLAELGYDYKTILTTYLPGTVPVNYRTILNTDK
jgi:stage II sporulation protein D